MPEGCNVNRQEIARPITNEDYRKALGEIQGALSACVGELIILSGYLESDLSLDPENTHYALMTAKNILREASDSVKTALGYTYPMV